MFTGGFEKIAVSAKWIGSKVGGGLATRAGHAAGSLAHADAKRAGSTLIDSMSKFYQNQGQSGRPPRHLVNILGKSTKKSPTASSEELKNIYESLKKGGK